MRRQAPRSPDGVSGLARQARLAAGAGLAVLPGMVAMLRPVLRPARAFVSGLALVAGLAGLAGPAAAQGNLTLLVEPYAGAVEREGDRVSQAFGRTERIIGFAGGQVLAEPFEGRILLMRFRNPADRSTAEIAANYRQALEGRGFVLDWACTGRADCGHQADGGWNRRNGMNLGIGRDVVYLTGRLPHEGGQVRVSVGVERANHYVQVLQADALTTGQVRILDAGAIAAALEAEGRIALDSILFAFGRADLLPESEAAIAEIAALLAAQPGIGLYVVGHSDSIGDFEANLVLSRARAEAVVRALETRHGVAPGRAVPAGVGPLAPVASNATEAGRALNRRVEAVLR